MKKNKKQLNKLASYAPLFVTTLAVGLTPIAAFAKDYFNPNALSNFDDASIADLQNLEQFSAGGQIPGTYNVTVILDDDTLGTKEISFEPNDNNQLEPVFTKKMLTDWGIKTDSIPAIKDLTDDAKIMGLGQYIEYATTSFNFSQLTLTINVPQIAMDSKVRGRIDPSSYDQGVPALMLNYDFSGARSWNKYSRTQNNQFLSLRSGANVGAWRLRNYSTYEHSDDQNRWNSINTYLERDIQPLNSQLTIGESTTTGEIFNGFQFTGAKIASDESMLPSSLRGFAPVVRGFAQGNAKVTVRQNGAIIYQTYVSAGPFSLTDLYPTSYNGNLDVTVEEDNGSKQSFIVPFSSLAIMQREGGLKYSATIGKYRPSNSGNGKKPKFMEGTIIYGLPLNTTIFGGSLLSNDYQSYALGLGFNLGDFGAISFDGKHASTKFELTNKKQNGQAYRLQYSKTLAKTNSTIVFEAYRYSTKGFYDFNQANEYTNSSTNRYARSRYQLNVSQSLAEYGSFYVSAYEQDYWHTGDKDRNINIGYNAVYNRISYGLSYGYTNSSSHNNSHQFAFRINIPLGGWGANNNYLTSSVNYSKQGKATIQTGISGSAIDNKLTYSVQQNYEQQNHYLGGNASVNYEGSSGNVNVGYAYTKDSERLNYGVQGGVVVHPQGITLSQTLSDTIAVIVAPGASHVSIDNTQGVETNHWGYAVKPYLTPYDKNQISLNLNDLGAEVDILNNSQVVVPTKGAVVMVDINTHIGNRVLMTLNLNGKPLPFGTVVSLTDGESSSIVGDNGEVYLSGMPNTGSLVVQWGKEDNQICKVNFTLADKPSDESVQFITADCTQ